MWDRPISIYPESYRLLLYSRTGEQRPVKVLSVRHWVLSSIN